MKINEVTEISDQTILESIGQQYPNFADNDSDDLIRLVRNHRAGESALSEPMSGADVLKLLGY